MIWNVKRRFLTTVTRSGTKMIVVSAATTSTTNMTGLLTITRGSSLANAAPTAGHTIFGSNRVGVPLRVAEVSMAGSGSIRREQGAGGHREMLGDGSERERREEREAADDHDHADREPNEQAPGGGERAGRRRHRLLRGKRPGDRHGWDDHQEAADEHRDRAGEVVEQGVPGQPRERRAVVAGLRRV